MASGISITYSYLLGMKEVAINRAQFWQFFSRKHLEDNILSDKAMDSLGAYARFSGMNENSLHVYEVANGPFFTLFNVGSYTFSPFKVAWPMGASKMRAAVIGDYAFNLEGGRATKAKCIVPATCTTSYVSFEDENKAHYFCAVLNSTIINSYICSFSSAGRGFGAPSIVSKIRIPDYNPDDKLQQQLSSLSKECHAATLSHPERLDALECDLDFSAAKLWGITDAELKAIQESLKKI